jgi:hypothetical protein
VSQGNSRGQAKEGEGMLHRLFRRARHEAPGTQSRSATPSALNLEDIQGFILRGYRMPMVRHFLLQVNVAAEARKLLGRFVMRRRSPPLKTGMWDSGQAPQTTPPIRRATSPTTVSTWA